jgi:hydroxymethylglutaryl-CoA lyase/(R)-citramalyl-CoA lyase
VRVTLCDVGPRDGLQNDEVTLSPGARAELSVRLADTGLPRVEVASFVHPKLVPQMAGAEDVFAALEPRPGTTYAALVLNRKGLERALAAGAREIHTSYGVTDSFNRRNQNASAEESAAATEEMIATAHEAGRTITATLSVAFGCPFEGRVDPGRVAQLCARLDADEIVLADTIGVATPTQVKRLVERVLSGRGDVGVHLHNTRNTGYANAVAALEAGATVLDASVGGLGGCPYAPKATGNIATEDLVYLLEGEGIGTGVDLDALIAVSEWLEGVLGRRLDGYVYRAGTWPPA